jgi:hypothetical protein
LANVDDKEDLTHRCLFGQQSWGNGYARPIEMTRQRIYDLVWLRPMYAAAASIPVSPITLKKIRLTHQVPVPALGYWSKPEAARQKARAPQRRWADGTSHRVEDLIDDIAAEAIARAEVIRSRREQIRHRVVKRVESERQWRQEREIERLQERFARLKKRVDLLERVERVAAALERLRAVGAEDQSMREFLDWADAQVGFLREHYSEPGIEDV